MAELFDGQDTEPFDISCHVGQRGDIIIPINKDIFIGMSPLEAKDLIALLQEELKKYMKALAEGEESLKNAA